MTEQEILNNAPDGATSVSCTGMYLQKPFGITYFYDESTSSWLKTDAAIFANSRLLSDVQTIATLQEELKTSD